MKPEQESFIRLCKLYGLPEPVPEFRFHAERKWRFDYLFEPDLALEIEGNPWASVNGQKSRHFHGKGILSDLQKYNEAAILGYRLIRCTHKDIKSGKVFDWLKRMLETD